MMQQEKDHGKMKNVQSLGVSHGHMRTWQPGETAAAEDHQHSH